MPTTTIPGANSHLISLTAATTLTGNCRANRDNILDSQYQNQDLIPLSETFNRAGIDLLLAQEGCEAIRIYYGMDTNLKLHAILVGVNENNGDILPSQQIIPSVEEDVILEEGQRCPIICPPESPLNS